MKRIGIVSTAALSLLLGIAIPAYAQDEKRDRKEEKQDQPANPAKQEEKRKQEAKPAQQEEKRSQEVRPAKQEEKRAQENKPAQQEEKRGQEMKLAQQEERRSQEVRPTQQNEQHAGQQANRERRERTPEQRQVEHTAWQQHRAQHWDSDHRTWQQRGGYNGYRIPDDRFRGSFGREHEFRIYGLPFLVEGGYPRFQYSGYWFSMVDPWPGEWADDWYDTDDVFVVYADNGYYLYNRRYPTVGIAINISM